MMRTLLLLILATSLFGAFLPVSHGQPPEARTLLDSVIAALPDVPLRVTGDLIARPRGDAPEIRRAVEMLLDWQAVPPTARYTVRDAFGGPLYHLAVTWDDPLQPSYRFFEGNPLRAAPAPPLTDPIPGTDLSWIDLSLSFLWWPDAKTVGREDVRGQTCWVVDVPAPPPFASHIAGVRLWISPRIRTLLRAETYDTSTNPVRRFEVKSFKRINNRWVIKDIEVVSFAARTRSVLRVRHVEDRTRRTFLREDHILPRPMAPAGPEETEEEGAVPADALLEAPDLAPGEEIPPIDPVDEPAFPPEPRSVEEGLNESP